MHEKKHNYIYKITNLINNKIYIGVHSTDDLNDGYMGSGISITNAIKKYGVENFKKEILVDFDTAEIAYRLEKMLVDEKFVKRRDTYNARVGGVGGKLTEEIKRKIGDANKGKRRSEEHKKKIAEAHKGKQLSEEHKQKISEAQMGEKNHMFGKRGEKSPNFGKHLSEEHKQKIAESLTGKHLSEEAKQKLAEANRGKHLSEEHKQKISESNKGKTFSEETRRKMSEAAKKRQKTRDANGCFVKGKKKGTQP